MTRHTILDDPGQRSVDIYIISCSETEKQYVGQAVTHILNHKRYRPYGYIGRFRGHISEAYSTKKKQCFYLNNAIRKYGNDKFSVKLLETTTISESDDREIYYIQKLKTLCPNGYNLTSGGNCSRLSQESRKKLSKTNTKSIHQRVKQFIPIMKKDNEPTIRPLRRHKKQYGWYVYWNGIKTDFGGTHIPLDDSYSRANTLVILLKEKRDTLLRETP